MRGHHLRMSVRQRQLGPEVVRHHVQHILAWCGFYCRRRRGKKEKKGHGAERRARPSPAAQQHCSTATAAAAHGHSLHSAQPAAAASHGHGHSSRLISSIRSGVDLDAACHTPLSLRKSRFRGVPYRPMLLCCCSAGVSLYSCTVLLQQLSTPPPAIARQ
jgi:hypothetical protein